MERAGAVFALLCVWPVEGQVFVEAGGGPLSPPGAAERICVSRVSNMRVLLLHYASAGLCVAPPDPDGAERPQPPSC